MDQYLHTPTRTPRDALYERTPYTSGCYQLHSRITRLQNWKSLPTCSVNESTVIFTDILLPYKAHDDLQIASAWVSRSLNAFDMYAEHTRHTTYLTVPVSAVAMTTAHTL